MPITQCPISLKSPGNEPKVEKENEADSAISRFLSSRYVHLAIRPKCQSTAATRNFFLLSSITYRRCCLIFLLYFFCFCLILSSSVRHRPISPGEEERRPGEKMNNSSQSLSSTALPFLFTNRSRILFGCFFVSPLDNTHTDNIHAWE